MTGGKMALRIIEVYLPAKDEFRIQSFLEECKVLDIWKERFSKELIFIRILLTAEKSEEVLDQLEKHISMVEGYRILLLSVEAAIPRVEPAKVKEPEQVEPEQKLNSRSPRISREELYEDIDKTINFSLIYVALVLLSSTVAAIGILQDNVAVIIGAMVIAPLLGPNLALSLATTLGDIGLARRAIWTNLVGIFSAVSLAFLIGFFLRFDPDIPGIVARTKVNLSDIILALAAGSAAALSFTTGTSSALIGVMVAVALLPPLVVLGMLLGSGNLLLANGATLLVLANLICINLAGVATFLMQGVRPRKFWDADRARKASRVALILWTFMLLLLVAVIYLSQRG